MTASPEDERLWLYQEVPCGRCGAVVEVAKFSLQHTSVQWTADATLTCAEFAARRQRDGATAPIPTCASLLASIRRATAHGRLAVRAP